MIAKLGRNWYQFQTKVFHCPFLLLQTILTNIPNKGQMLDSQPIVPHPRTFQYRLLMLASLSLVPPRCQFFCSQVIQLPFTIITNILVRIVIILQNADGAQVKIIHSLTSHLQNVWSFLQESTKATDVPLNQVVHSPLLHVIHSFILLPPF